MTRAKGTRKPCDVQQARQRLVDARQFLEAAKLLDAPDVVATCAIHAAIAASDAITCHALGERSNDGNHVSAVDLRRRSTPSWPPLSSGRSIARPRRATRASTSAPPMLRVASSGPTSCWLPPRRGFRLEETCGRLGGHSSARSVGSYVNCLRSNSSFVMSSGRMCDAKPHSSQTTEPLI